MLRDMDIAVISGVNVPCILERTEVEILDTVGVFTTITVAADRISDSEIKAFNTPIDYISISTGDVIQKIVRMNLHDAVGPLTVKVIQMDTSGYAVLVLEDA